MFCHILTTISTIVGTPILRAPCRRCFLWSTTGPVSKDASTFLFFHQCAKMVTLSANDNTWTAWWESCRCKGLSLETFGWLSCSWSWFPSSFVETQITACGKDVQYKHRLCDELHCKFTERDLPDCAPPMVVALFIAFDHPCFVGRQKYSSWDDNTDLWSQDAVGKVRDFEN